MKVILVILYLILLVGGIVLVKPWAVLGALLTMILYFVIDFYENPEDP